MTIPNEAIEAAAGAFHHGWDSTPEEWRVVGRARMREALEAAAPHMLKDLRELVDEMEAQPWSERASLPGVGAFIRGTMRGML